MVALAYRKQLHIFCAVLTTLIWMGLLLSNETAERVKLKSSAATHHCQCHPNTHHFAIQIALQTCHSQERVYQEEKKSHGNHPYGTLPQAKATLQPCKRNIDDSFAPL